MRTKQREWIPGAESFRFDEREQLDPSLQGLICLDAQDELAPPQNLSTALSISDYRPKAPGGLACHTPLYPLQSEKSYGPL
jgi:hypothetical protein